MANRTHRPSVSMRGTVYARLKHYVDGEQLRTGTTEVSCSNVVEAALKKYLDERGVPANVPVPERKPRIAKSRTADTKTHPMDDRPAMISF